jgi:MFS transporter, PPP family, 3-phenylpropionic acid transporter
MSGNPQIPTAEAFAWRLAAFYAALFVALGVQLPFLPVWLAAMELDAQQIGIVLAIPMVVRIVAIPLAARLADRRDALRGSLMLAAGLAAIGYGIVGLANGVLAIMLAYVLVSAFYTPMMPLADAYALRGLGERRASYGPVRLWGSAAFIVGSFGAGLLLNVIGARDLIWLIAGAMVPAALAACALKPLGLRAAVGHAPPVSARGLLGNRAFLAVAAAASLIQASHAVYYGFSALDWRAAGLGGSTIGALWALGVLAEIGVFALSARLGIGPVALVLIGAGGGVLRWAAMAFDPPLALLPALQCLHALSFGATHLGAIAFIARAAPPEIGATAQGYFAVAQGLMMAVAMGLSGVLYARYGNLAYLAMALTAALGGFSALAAGRFLRAAVAT